MRSTGSVEELGIEVIRPLPAEREHEYCDEHCSGKRDDDLEECDDLTEDTAETEELEEEDEGAEKDEFELNESFINFSTRLIRG